MIIQREKYNHTVQSDIYSLGVVLVQLLSRPFVKKEDPIHKNPKWMYWLI